MKHQITLLFALIAFGPGLKASEWYSAPNVGGTGNGSITNPWSISVALTNRSSIQPGDTVWLRGGSYNITNATFKSTLLGASGNPVVVRQYPGERAILAANNETNKIMVLDVEGSYTWWWGFEVVNSNTNRFLGTDDEPPLRGDAIQMNITSAGNNNKLINLIIHDGDDGIYLSAQSTNAEVTGCIIYNNGCEGLAKGHGHDYYAQNNPNAGTKVFRNNLCLNCFSTGITPHGSGSGAAICGINILDNIVYGSGKPSAFGPYENVVIYNGTNNQGTIDVDNIVFGGNVALTSASQNITLGYSQPIPNEGSLIFTNNLAINGTSAFYYWTNVVCSNNIFVLYPTGTFREYCSNSPSFFSDFNSFYTTAGFSIATSTNGSENFVPFATWQGMGYDTHSTTSVGYPTNSATVVIQKNPYESGRAHIAVANWHTNDNVSVDVSGVLSTGMTYEVHNASDYFGTLVANGVYSGGTISLPMTNLSVAVPIGMQTAPAPTGPKFNAFVIIGNPPPAPPPILLTGAAKLPNGAFQFAFTNTPVGTTNITTNITTTITTNWSKWGPPKIIGYTTNITPTLTTNTSEDTATVLTTTNLLLPLTNWTVLGTVTDNPPGQFQFSDPQATNHPLRFYRVRSP